MAGHGTVVCLVLHGIGTYASEFDDEALRFDADLRTRVQARLGDRFEADIIWTPILWSDAELERRQERLFTGRPWRGAHEFVTSALCDAATYQYFDGPRYKNSNYQRVQTAVHNAVLKAEAAVRARGEDPAATPVMAICHSMGCHVFSSFAWDIINAPERVIGSDRTPGAFERLDTLSAAVFTGCNIPIFTAGIDRVRKLPLHIDRFDHLAHVQRWYNFFDPDDPLGYPLEVEYADYYADSPDPAMIRLQERFGRTPEREVPVQDLELDLSVFDIGLSALTPLVHNSYWRAKEITDPISDLLINLSDAQAAAP